MAQARRDMGELRPIDDLMFRVMARDEAFCGELLGVLLEDRGLTVVKSTPQSHVTNTRAARRSSTPSASFPTAGS